MIDRTQGPRPQDPLYFDFATEVHRLGELSVGEAVHWLHTQDMHEKGLVERLWRLCQCGVTRTEIRVMRDQFGRHVIVKRLPEKRPRRTAGPFIPGLSPDDVSGLVHRTLKPGS